MDAQHRHPSSPASQSGRTAYKKRSSHSRSGCATCRKRRVRCDERREVCGNCSQLNLTCEWYHASNRSQRSRVNNACGRCRKKRIRCTSKSGAVPCDPCQSANADCINEKQTDPDRLVGVSNNSSPVKFPGKEELRRLLNAYFEGPHFFCFYTFIHQPTFEQMFDNGLVPDFLLLIVIATGLRFQEPHNRLPDQWADECRRLVMSEIFSPPSTTTLQALLLLQRYEWHRAAHVNAWFISGLVVRLTHGLQLNIEISDEARVPVTVRETRRRLMWSCFVMESMIEAGRSPLSGLDVSSIEVKLPCDERSFQLGVETHMADLDHLLDARIKPPNIPNATALSASECRPGISAFLVHLAALRRNILHYTLPYHPRNRGHIPLTLPWDLDSPFMRYEEKLDEWRRCLPEELRFNSEVMYRRQPQLVSFVTLHCLFHGCYCDLYRIGSHIIASHRVSGSSIPLPAAAEPFLENCRRGRLQHAFAICKIISESMNHQTSGHDPVVAICISLAIRVLVIERQPDDSAALGLTDEIVYANLDMAVKCAKELVQRSVPIRELFCSICNLARQLGYDVDLSSISYPPGIPSQQQLTRAPSPSLRTYGTFGSIQSSLAMRKDSLAPAASSSTEKESDLFNYYQPPNSTQPQATDDPQGGHGNVAALSDLPWSANTPSLPYETFSPNELGVASGWGDGTLNFSMNPAQIDWVNQSLGLDFSNSFVYDPSLAL